MAAGFTVASIYTVGWLRGRRDRYHRLGILIPFTVAAIATPLQFIAGDTTARAVYKDQPAKFAAMEVVTQTGTDQTGDHLRPVRRGDQHRRRRHPDPGPQLDPRRVQPGHQRPGARRVRARGPAVQRERRALGVRHMVVIACLLILMVLLFAFAYWRRRDVPRNRPLLWLVAGVRRPDVHRDRGRLDRHRGRPPAVDRLRPPAHLRRGHPDPGEHGLHDLHDRHDAVRPAGDRHGRRAAGDVAPVAAAGRAPTTRRRTGRGRRPRARRGHATAAAHRLGGARGSEAHRRESAPSGVEP